MNEQEPKEVVIPDEHFPVVANTTVRSAMNGVVQNFRARVLEDGPGITLYPPMGGWIALSQQGLDDLIRGLVQWRTYLREKYKPVGWQLVCVPTGETRIVPEGHAVVLLGDSIAVRSADGVLGEALPAMDWSFMPIFAK